MRTTEAVGSSGARRRGAWVTLGVLAATAFAACTGENIFPTGTVAANRLSGPDVTITSPSGNTSVVAGAAASVTATATSSQGISQMVFSGVFDAGGTAFTSQTVTLPNPKDTTLTRSLTQSGTTTGGAKIIVQATDIFGATGADTVAITVGP